MKIKVLGCGSMVSINNSASYLIDNHILLDIPNGTCKTLQRININPYDIDHILITHFHADHYFDIPFLLSSKHVKEKEDLFIYLDEKNKYKITELTNLAFPGSMKYINNNTNINYITKNNFKINNYNVQKILVDHGHLKPAFGYIFKTEKNIIGFTGDSAYCEAIEKMASQCTHLFCDCNFEIGTYKHMGINDIEKLALQNPNCSFYCSHMLDKTKEQLKSVTIKNIFILNDLDEFDYL